MDPDTFHPERGVSTYTAKSICKGQAEGFGPCPVRSDCLDYALSNGLIHGVWGGLSEKERRRIRSNRRQIA